MSKTSLIYDGENLEGCGFKDIEIIPAHIYIKSIIENTFLQGEKTKILVMQSIVLI